MLINFKLDHFIQMTEEEAIDFYSLLTGLQIPYELQDSPITPILEALRNDILNAVPENLVSVLLEHYDHNKHLYFTQQSKIEKAGKAAVNLINQELKIINQQSKN